MSKVHIRDLIFGTTMTPQFHLLFETRATVIGSFQIAFVTSSFAFETLIYVCIWNERT